MPINAGNESKNDMLITIGFSFLRGRGLLGIEPRGSWMKLTLYNLAVSSSLLLDLIIHKTAL
jgi:hypothetical protein